MNEMWGGVITVATAIVGVAILAVLVSKQANTSQVISSAARGFAADLQAAVSPITGTTNTLGGLSLSGGANSVLNY